MVLKKQSKTVHGFCPRNYAAIIDELQKYGTGHAKGFTGSYKGQTHPPFPAPNPRSLPQQPGLTARAVSARTRTHTCAHAAHARSGLCGAALAALAGWAEAREIGGGVVVSVSEG